MTPADYAVTQSATSLHGSLQHLYGLKPSREVFAQEAVKMIAKAAGVSNAALLGCDQRATCLHPLANFGLTPAAIKILVSRGGRWIGLRCLNERRLSVVAAAHENPFVPPQLVAAAGGTRLAIAAVPFYYRDVPVGVAVLFSNDPHTFSDAVLYSVSQALRVCGAALAELSSSGADALNKVRRAPGQARPALPQFDLRGRTQVHRGGPDTPLDAATAPGVREAEQQRVVQLERELQALREAGKRLPALQAEVERLNRQARDARVAAENAKAHATKLEAERIEAEKRAQAANQILEALVAAQDESEGRLEETLVVARERNGFIAQIEDRLREIAHYASKTHQLQQALASSESSRARLEEEVTRLRDQFATSQADRIELQAALQERTEALNAVQTQVRELTAQLAGAQAEIESLRAGGDSLAKLQQELQALVAERTLLGDELENARATISKQAQEAASAARVWTARIGALEAERNELKDELAQARADIAEANRRIQEQIEIDQRERQEMAQQIAALADAESRRSRFQVRLEEIERALLQERLQPVQNKGRVNRKELERELREAFALEASECLESCEQLLEMLERNPEDRELRAALYRRFHMLKEAAGMLGSFSIPRPA